MNADEVVRKCGRGWGLAVGGAALVVGLASLPPFLEEPARAVLMQAFAGVCHQLPERSAQLGGVPLAVCHRCYGIYWGLLAATLCFPLLPARLHPVLHRRLGPVLLVSLFPPGIDWLGGVLALWSSPPPVRLLTGAVFGVAAGYALARALSRTLDRPRAARQAT